MPCVMVWTRIGCLLFTHYTIFYYLNGTANFQMSQHEWEFEVWFITTTCCGQLFCVLHVCLGWMRIRGNSPLLIKRIKQIDRSIIPAETYITTLQSLHTATALLHCHKFRSSHNWSNEREKLELVVDYIIKMFSAEKRYHHLTNLIE